LTTAAQGELCSWLEMAGARPAGHRRYSCPACGGLRTVAVNGERGVFYCHHSGCAFRGSIRTLRERLGLGRQWLPRAELIRRQRAHDAARRLAAGVHTLRMELLSTLRELGQLEIRAHSVGLAHRGTWDALAFFCRQQADVLEELEILESGGAGEVLRLVLAGRHEQATVVSKDLHPRVCGSTDR